MRIQQLHQPPPLQCVPVDPCHQIPWLDPSSRRGGSDADAADDILFIEVDAERPVGAPSDAHLQRADGRLGGEAVRLERHVH